MHHLIPHKAVSRLLLNPGSRSAASLLASNRHMLPTHTGQESDEELLLLYLQDHGIDINAVDNEGRTVLHYAAHTDYPKMLSALLACDGNATLLDNYGYTPRTYMKLRGSKGNDGLMARRLRAAEKKNNKKKGCVLM